jgi:MFS family permease
MTLPILYVAVFVLGIGETLFDNAAQSIVPMIVEPFALQDANARFFGANIVTTELAGPPLGSFLFAIAAAIPFVVDAGSFAGSVLLLLLIRGMFRPQRAAGARPSIRREIAEGARWLWRDVLLRRMALSLGLFNLFSQGAVATLVLFALEILHLKASGYGILLGAGAAGGVLGSLVSTRVTKKMSGGIALVLIGLVSGATLLAIGAMNHVWAVMALFAVSGFGSIVWNVITVSLRQTLIPTHLMGRVNSMYRFIGWGAIPVGAALGGVLARVAGLRAPFYVGGGGILIASLILFTRMIPGIRAIEERS